MVYALGFGVEGLGLRVTRFEKPRTQIGISSPSPPFLLVNLMVKRPVQERPMGAESFRASLGKARLVKCLLYFRWEHSQFTNLGSIKITTRLL